MTAQEASGLLKLLTAAHPRTRIEDDTAALWLQELRALGYCQGHQAVWALIKTTKFWPSLAELHEQVGIVRGHLARARREQEQREAGHIADGLPRPQLKDIPAAMELLQQFAPPVRLPHADPGKCDDDCGTTGPRYQYGCLRVCEGCARSRLRARGAA